MRSEEFIELKSRIESLSTRYLPATRADGLYTDEEQDLMRALRLLSHAEIENYLEERCILLISDLKREMQNQKNRSAPVEFWISNAIKIATEASKSNNGITHDCIIKMFSHLGISEKEIDSIDPLKELTKFGKQRGDVAHRSALRASYSLNREREKKKIDEVLASLEKLDRLILSRRLQNMVTT